MSKRQLERGIIDAMVARTESGCNVACGTRFMPTAAWSAAVGLSPRCCAGRLIISAGCRLENLPTAPDCPHDARSIGSSIGSHRGFCYSIELVTKCRRLHRCITEVPAKLRARTRGMSCIRVMKWLAARLVPTCGGRPGRG